MEPLILVVIKGSVMIGGGYVVVPVWIPELGGGGGVFSLEDPLRV